LSIKFLNANTMASATGDEPRNPDSGALTEQHDEQ
jgi:hypothetical protein